MNQDVVARPHSKHVEEHVVGGQVVDRHRRSVLEGHRFRHLEGLGRIHADRIGVAAESGHRHGPLSHLGRIHARADRIDHARNLVAHYHRGWRRIPIEPLARHDLCEVDPRCADTNPDFVRARLRIRRAANFQDVRLSIFRDPYRLHDPRVPPTETMSSYERTC